MIESIQKNLELKGHNDLSDKISQLCCESGLFTKEKNKEDLAIQSIKNLIKTKAKELNVNPKTFVTRIYQRF